MNDGWSANSPLRFVLDSMTSKDVENVKSVKERLTALEDLLLTGDVLLVVRLPDGSMKEVTLEEYRQHACEWDFVHVTQCKTPQAAAEILTLWVGDTAIR